MLEDFKCSMYVCISRVFIICQYYFYGVGSDHLTVNDLSDVYDAI